MKKPIKILYILQIILMYIVHLPFYIAFIMIKTAGTDYDNIIIGLLLAGCITTLLILPLCLANAITAILSLFKGNYNPTKMTLISKIILIPWYVMNFIICILLIAGFLNPFLLVAVPIILIFLVSVTYLIMLSTSVYDIAYVIQKLIKKEEKISAFIVISLICLFSFCLDLIGALIVYLKTRSNKESIEE